MLPQFGNWDWWSMNDTCVDHRFASFNRRGRWRFKSTVEVHRSHHHHSLKLYSSFILTRKLEQKPFHNSIHRPSLPLIDTCQVHINSWEMEKKTMKVLISMDLEEKIAILQLYWGFDFQAFSRISFELIHCLLSIILITFFWTLQKFTFKLSI